MIELTVKTLDSQNHSFSVPDDTTVKQLKERIAESISFPVESQRLIYCGRVLQDEKLLSEYDVNGKVIHLVQRPPPQVTRQNGNQSSNRTTSGQHRRANHAFRPRVDANAMYLGAMAFPADLMDAQGIQAPPSSNVLSTSRVSLARNMLARASNVLNRLENPQTSQEETSETPPGEDENVTASSSAVGSITVTDNVGGGNQSLPSTLAHATQAATAAAIAAAVSAAHAVGVPNITIVRGGSGSGQQQDASILVSGNSGGDSQDAGAQDQPATSESTSGNSQPTGTSPNSDDNSGRGPETVRTAAMGEILATMTRIQQRLSPFIQQYQRLMNEDPPFDENVTLAQDSQTVFNGVSEVFHYLSHAYHAMSDIMCDFSQPPPRSLRCRPVLIQHSAVLQAQINVMTNRGSDNRNRQTASSQTNISTTSSGTNNTNGAQNSSAPPAVNVSDQSETASNETPATAPVTTSSVQDTTFQPQVSTTASSQQQQQQQQQPQQQRQTEGNSVPHPTFHITPGNVEFFMEVGPSSITIDSLEATVVTNSNGGNGGNGGTDGNGAGAFPWGGAAPPEFIQNLVHALGGHMMGRMGGTQNNGNSATGGVTAGAVPAPAAGNGGQNSQARGNTATYPTTATQTRSTSRPHVHLAPAAVPGLGSNYFDPFLPCNSHHIRSRRRGASQAAAQQPSQQQSQTQSQSQSQSQQQVPANEPDAEQANTAAIDLSQASARTSATAAVTAATTTSSSSSSSSGGGGGGGGSSSSSSSSSSGSGSSTLPAGGAASNNQQQQQQQQQQRRDLPPGVPPNLLEVLRTFIPRNAQVPPLSNFPNLMQAFQSFPAYSQDALLGALFGGGSLADLLSSFPDHSYVEGQSVFLDFLMTMAQNMSFNDIILLSVGGVGILSRVRPRLQDFIRQKVLQGRDTSEENVAVAVHALLQELRPHLKLLGQAKVKDEVDIILSVNQYNQIKLPELIHIIMSEARDDIFCRRFVQWFVQYAREVAAIVRYCCVDDLQGLVNVAEIYVRQLMSGVQADVRDWTISSSLSQIQSFVTSQTVPVEDIQPFLVYRIPSPPSSLQHGSVPVSFNATSAEQLDEEEQVTEPMETDSDTPTVNGSLTLETHSFSESETDVVQSPTNLIMDSETLPDVVIGAETWHNVLPSDWVPIITRDTQRQRKQNSQAPFSDAYLSGMPSKRRKIVSSAKPQGNVGQILADGVRHAVASAGIRETPDMEAAGEDLELQAAYREQMKLSFQDNVGTSSDVTNERFPNTTKYFEK
ncbi:large proline-rich protein BAG6 isoform X2 [Schistocerca piceifrons]|uniref:large proline-rich protein BAG6 isoform X2 n=1 Tax=Schistocerca piceifrons TaxID=274613 RepID=UPI001F5FB184|nr:large proline-rich protein BAG6 isoform X2 [Schistocerca piceifrons]